MLVIYLDKNIINHLKNDPKGELSRKFQELKPFAVFPFSRPTLSDLCAGYDQNNSDIVKRVEEDLNLISEITDGLYLTKKTGDKSIKYYIGNATELFRQELKVRNEKAVDALKYLENLPSTGLPEMDQLLKLQINLLKAQPIPKEMDFVELRKTEEGTIIANMFPRAEKSGKFWDMMIDMMIDIMDWKDSLDDNPSNYKDIRDMLDKHTRLKGKAGSLDSNIYEELNKLMFNSSVGKSFDEILELGELKGRRKNKTLESEFSNDFIMVDMLYKSDPLKKGYTNFYNDSQHAFIGAHADVFITEDERTRMKAQAVYEKRKLGTKAYSIGEFLDSFSDIKYDHSINDILGVRKLIEGLDPDGQATNQVGTLERYILNNKILNFYNRIDFLKSQDGKLSFNLIHEPSNYMNSISFHLFEKLTNYLHDILGPDFRSREKLNPKEENDKILKREWSGRKWELEDNVLIFFNMLKGDNFPRLVIVYNTIIK